MGRKYPETGYRSGATRKDIELVRQGRYDRGWTAVPGWRYQIVRIKHPYWASCTGRLTVIHISRTEGLAHIFKGHIQDFKLSFLCNGGVSYALPVGPADNGRELCARCMAAVEKDGWPWPVKAP